jgi:hypothetical protein
MEFKSMKLDEQIRLGIKQAIDRQWRYTKNLTNIKPEYLLTIAVADALSQGFDEIAGVDLEILLEESTRRISADLQIQTSGLSNYFAEQLKNFISRKGRVDIYLKSDSARWIVEVKGLDPATKEIQKELIRLSEFLSANATGLVCKGCFLAFPTLQQQSDRINAIWKAINCSQSVQISFADEFVKTGETPETGIPAYYANCISLNSAPVPK